MTTGGVGSESLTATLVPGRAIRQSSCMTMLSFGVDDREAKEAQRWAETLGIDRSEPLCEALRCHLNRLASEGDVAEQVFT